MPTEKFEINLNKKEIKTAVDDVNKNDYFKRITTQVKKLRSGQMDQAFKGNVEKWRKTFHDSDLEKYDFMILSVLREDYTKYQQYIQAIKKLIDFHDIKLKKS